MKTRILFFIPFCLLSCALLAQTEGGNGNVTPESFDVVKAYEPVLADALKVSFNPDLPSYEESQKNKPSFKDYYVPTRLMNISYDPPALKPLKYDDSKNKGKQAESENPYHFWLRAGFGNLLTPLADLSVSNGKSDRFSIGANAFYNSARGKIDYQDFRRVGGKVFGKAFFGSSALGVYADYQQHQLYYYGYDHADTSLELSADSIKQRYQNIGAGVDFSNTQTNDAAVDYRIAIDFLRTNNQQANSENGMNSRIDLSKGIGEHFVLAWQNLLGFSKYSFENKSDLCLNSTPTLSYVADFGRFSLGASALSTAQQFRVFPYLELVGDLSKQVSLYGRWNKSIIDNDYATMTRQNPFVDAQIDLQNTLNEERAIGMKVHTKQWNFHLKAFQHINQNQALLLNTHTDIDRFVAVYDTVQSLGGQIHLGYDVTQKIQISLQTTYQTYSTRNQTHAWHLPNLVANLGIEFLPVKQLSVGTQLFVQQGMKAQLPSGNSTTLPALIDLNFSTKYQLSKNFALFANANNLLNRTNGQFYNYSTYGINALGGVLLRF